MAEVVGSSPTLRTSNHPLKSLLDLRVIFVSGTVSYVIRYDLLPKN